MNKRVFVIIVTFNGEKWLHKNIKSLIKSNYPVEVIVVDNNSTDNSMSIIKQYQKIQLIVSEENLGFGKANNLAIKSALQQQADYVFLLNQDTWIEPNTIGDLLAIAESNISFGIISPIHFSANESQLDVSFKKYYKNKKAISKQIDKVDFINAAAWLVARRVIEKVGYFEPMFQHYGEDRNYVHRINFHGFKTVVVNNAKFYHDRIVSRNFNKDITQSKYRILGDVLNINDSLFVGYLKGFRSVFGLPKYFYKYYSFASILQLLFVLLAYYLKLKLHIFSILKRRNSYY